MNEFSEKISDRIDDLIEIYGDDALDFAKKNVVAEFFVEESPFDDEPDDGEIENLQEFFDKAAEFIAEKESLETGRISGIITAWIAEEFEETFGDVLEEYLWQSRSFGTNEDEAYDKNRDLEDAK